jgi:hypothetical protein
MKEFFMNKSKHKNLFILTLITLTVLPMYTAEKKPLYEILARQETEKWFQNEKMVHEFPSTAEREETYQKLIKEYQFYEAHLEKIKTNPLASIWGGINYAMTLDEMKQKIREKFNEMKKQGLIISKNKFEKIKNKYWTTLRYPSAAHDLTRIWGIDYLKNKIDESKFLRDKYDVPNYVIVADDPTNIKVKVYFLNRNYPVVNSLENASLYFENIIGKRAASRNLQDLDIGRASGIGYDDFSDPGNIIFDEKTGKYYVVDTEYKSFKIPIGSKLKYLLEYAANRFNYLNPDLGISYTFELNLD